MILQRHHKEIHPAGFTLVELILVMVVLTTILAIVAPSLSHSFQQHKLDQEATRLVAFTEYGRDEAVSQGVPMIVWIDVEKGTFGLDAADGYTASDVSKKQYALDSDLHFEMQKNNATKDGRAFAVQFAPDGSPDASAVDSIRIVDHLNSSVLVQRTQDGWSYEIAKEGADAPIRR